MKYLILLLTTTTAILSGWSQTETTVWNGKTYYVYPHQVEIPENEYLFMEFAEYHEVLQRDEKNRKVVGKTVEKIEDEMNGFMYGTGKKSKEQKEGEKFLREILSKKPDIIYRYEQVFERDVTPALEAIPDGEYIQYYRDLPYLDNNVIRYRNDVVAGIFTVKNNQLNGKGIWFTASGLVMKTGEYSNGSRDGEWHFNTFTPSAKQFEGKKETAEVLEYIMSNNIIMDTTIEITHYSNGLKNGAYSRRFNSSVLTSGHYSNNKETGTWDFYEFRYEQKGEMDYRRTDTIVHTKHYTIAEKPPRGKGVIIRETVVPYELLYGGSEMYYDGEEMVSSRKNDPDTGLVLSNPTNLLSSNNEFEDFGSFYTILKNEKESEEGLELPEEELTSYEGEEYEEEYPYYDEEHYEEMAYYDEKGYYEGEVASGQFINGKRYSRNQLIDSLGYEFIYEGIYEEYYINGQLKMRFEIRNGQLVKEDTMFWSNGQAANTVHFDPETKQYIQNFFDYNGRLYKTAIFDEKGESLEKEERDPRNHVEINGLDYYMDRGEVMEYHIPKMDSVLTENTLLLANRWILDTVLCSSTYLDPATQTLQTTEYNRLGDAYYTETAQFGENYENVNAHTNFTIGKLRLETTMSGAEFGDMFGFFYPKGQDTLNPQANALYWQEKFDLTSDAILYNGDQPFTGKFMLNTDASSFKIKNATDAISVSLPGLDKQRKLIRKAFNKYLKHGKRSSILEWYNQNTYYSTINQTVFQMFPSLDRVFGSNYSEYDYEYSMYMNGRSKNVAPYDKTIEGQFLNGKPEGFWIVKDQFGNTRTRMNYRNGELDGEIQHFDVEYPLSEDELNRRNEYIEEYHLYLFDTPPEKKTRFLSATENYKNGLLNGPAVSMNWKGDTLSYNNYRDGLEQGTSYQRNKLFYSVAGYEDGMIDGISQTYLTIPERDSILLFDLNFQNGSLQGESKSYHTNGKLAKRGFFLNGQPIDDYEAYDTLGFKYQYVKFQYGQPVEEKIWEENQLSVRYLFKWEDSIEFNTPDIAGSSSFERLAYDLGIIRNPYSEPYYGRPSLVDKSGIDYSITKYYPNDTVAREGQISKGKKVGHWKYYSYEGKLLYEVNYFDSVLKINDSIRFKSKGILTYPDAKGQPASRSWVVEKVEKYDCSHSDHNEERMLYTFWEADTSVHCINGYVKNYYDNGSIMNEGYVENGLATGVWKMYDSDGNLNQVGTYKIGKRDGRWLKGDLGNVKNMGEICLNPNLENLEEIIAYQEKLLDISVIYYSIGKILKREYYGINMNNGEAPDGYDDGYYDGEYYGE